MLAIDIGTSSVRALAYDSRLRPVPGGEAHEPYTPRLTRDGGAETHPRLPQRLAVRAVDRVLAALPGAEFAAAGISAYWHGLVAVDPGGRPLTPAYLWSDGRAWREAERLRRRLAEPGVHARTGCRIHPSYWPAKIAWLRGRDRRLRGAGVRFASPADLLAASLFGDPATSASLASGTGLFGLRRAAWDGELLEILGLGRAALPEVGEAPRRLTPSWRRRWPQLAAATWAPPLGDGAAANLGSGCLHPDRRAVTIGTSAALRVTCAAPPRRLPPSLWCYRAGGGRYVAGGAFSNGGNLFAWLRATLAAGAAPAGRIPGAHGLTFLPLLAGERSPGFALRATGAVAGLTLATGPGDLVQAALESVAVQFARVDRDLDRVLPGARLLVASGAGLLADPAWMRMICDASGKPLAAGRAREASSRGAALLALEAAGLAPDPGRLDPGSERPLRPRTTSAVRAAYDAAIARQQALYRVLVAGGFLEAGAGAAPAHWS